MDLTPLFTRRTTPGQWKIGVWASIVTLTLIGVMAFCFSMGDVTPAQAASFRAVSFSSFSLALIVWVIKRLITRFLS